MSSPSTSGTEPKSQCPGFEPQQWRSSVCKNCFRSADWHGERRFSSPPETEVEESTDADQQTTEYGMDNPNDDDDNDDDDYDDNDNNTR